MRFMYTSYGLCCYRLIAFLVILYYYILYAPSLLIQLVANAALLGNLLLRKNSCGYFTDTLFMYILQVKIWDPSLRGSELRTTLKGHTR